MRGHGTEKHRRRRWPWILATTVGAAVVLAAVGIPLGGAQLLLTPHHSMTTAAGQVLSLTADEVTLSRTAAGERVGTYGLIWSTSSGSEAGSAIVGPVTAVTEDSVTRPISGIRGELPVGTHVELNPNIWDGDPQTALDIPFHDVDIDGQLGPMRAWQVDGSGTTWVLFVHGIDGQQASGLRPLPTIVDAGLPTLLITYRNDIGAPPSPNGLISLGQTEWHDLDSAAEYAVGQGATAFVLYGDSMGGSIVTQFMHQSQYADEVVGMVLDAPVLNWAGVLQGQADRLHLGAFGGLLQLAVSWRGGIDLAALDELDQTETFDGLPILLFQGLADPLVPPQESKQFADSLPGVRYVPVADAGHIQSWNVDPGSYESHLAAFLQPFGSAEPAD